MPNGRCDGLDTLKGKKIMVWTFMGNTRMYTALRNYGDRISQIGLFSFKVRANGEIYERGVAISNMLTYINRYPHINWLLTVANDRIKSSNKKRRRKGKNNLYLRRCFFCIHSAANISVPSLNRKLILPSGRTVPFSMSVSQS